MYPPPPSPSQVISFAFPDCGTIPPPVIMVQGVSFRYSDERPWVYKNIDFGIDLETRLALVGPNGAGKSTLLKLIDGEVSILLQLDELSSSIDNPKMSRCT